MVPCDVSILKFLKNIEDYQGNPATQTPKSIASNIPYSRNHVGNRCRTLTDYDLLERVAKGEYRLTEKGQALMNGGLEPESLSDDD